MVDSIGGIVAELNTAQAILVSVETRLGRTGELLDELLMGSLELELISTAERIAQLSDALESLLNEVKTAGHRAVAVTATAAALGGRHRAVEAQRSPPPKPSQPGPGRAEGRKFKKPVHGSGKEKSTGAPSWVKRHPEGRPLSGENGNAFARRMMNDQYGEGKWDDSPRGRAPGTEYGKIKKYGERAFE